MANGKWRIANGRRWEWAALVAILLAAAFLRLYRLDALPPGLTHDEAGHVHDATAIVGGARPIYQTVGYGREPLYDYLGAGLIALGIPAVTALRLLSASCGLLTLLLTFVWVRQAFDGPTALLATALQAVSFWSLAVSRQALRSSLLLALFTAALYLFWRAIYLPSSYSLRGDRQIPVPAKRGSGDPFQAWGAWALALFAVLLGATLYTYIPARVLWLLFPAFLAYLALYHHAVFRRIAVPALIAIGVGLLLSAPLFLYLRANPGLEQRLGMLDEPLRALAAGDASVVLRRAVSCIAAFVVPGQGDDFLAYNTPGRPFLDPITSVLFLAGVVICLLRLRQPGCAMTLLWFAVSISPSLVTGAAASTTRSITALPPTFLFPAIAAVTGARWIASLRPRGIWRSPRSRKDELQTTWGQYTRPITVSALAAFVSISGVWAVRDYAAWANTPEVRAAYMHTLVQTANYLDAAPESGLVALSTALPQAPHDPYVFEASLRRSDLPTRWFNGQRAMILPAASTARLIVPAVATLDPYFADLPGLTFHERVSMRPDDLNPYFDVYDWRPQVTRRALLDRAQGTLLDMALPVDVDGALSLRGYDLRTPTVAPGGMVELITFWEVANPARVQPQDLANAEQELVFFTHALDAAGVIAGQDDRLDGPAWSWQTGDMVAQIHRFALSGDVTPGMLELVIGVYRRADMTRLPVRVDGTAVGDLIRLAPLEVRAP
ncbi:MAG: glycosyltransferase family 39 protein [Anaerolineae bacterium]